VVNRRTSADTDKWGRVIIDVPDRDLLGTAVEAGEVSVINPVWVTSEGNTWTRVVDVLTNDIESGRVENSGVDINAGTTSLVSITDGSQGGRGAVGRRAWLVVQLDNTLGREGLVVKDIERLRDTSADNADTTVGIKAVKWVWLLTKGLDFTNDRHGGWVNGDGAVVGVVTVPDEAFIVAVLLTLGWALRLWWALRLGDRL